MTREIQLTLFVTFHVKPSMIEEFKIAHRPDPGQPGRFRLVEVWGPTREWLETEQLTKSYYATIWERSRPTWDKEIEIEFFERLGEGYIYRKGYLDGGKLMG
ncbi:hypothetical protein F4810DRAFT_715469 [Camillea tinctor]|nr:hypothetical protein F4810DRAFT_715469 [Camillea tinctor]